MDASGFIPPAWRRCGATARLVATALLAAGLAAPPSARADRVELADGRVLEGRFAKLPGVAVDPLAETGSGPAGEPILMCDDELTRTMVSKRTVVKVEEAAFDRGIERVLIPQRVPENGRHVAGVGAILETTPFDEFGRRILSLATASGRVDVVQGITEITPRWTRVEGIQTEKPLILDMRLATTSIPPDVLKRVVAQHIDRTNADERLRVVRLLLQGDRYDDAKRELDAVVADFPDLADLAKERRTIAQLSAARLLDEIQMRGRVGQDRLALQMLEHFPAADAGGEMLEAVREARERYRTRRDLAARLIGQVRERLAALEKDGQRTEAEAVVDEMQRELSFTSLDRLSTFDRVGTDPAVPADRAVALAISGWLQGAAAAGDNLKLAVSAARVRGLLRDYLRTSDQAGRDTLLARLRGEEASDPATLAALAAHMRPPFDPPESTSPGLHELTVPGLEGTGDVRCLVQLPPEYDPLRRYPAIVTLHAAWSTPLNQIEWWAGMPGPDGLRLGQATRHGAIVVAPAWGQPHQSGYDYSPREHAAVLASLREALRRFSIDTDRVFLSGHSLGGDAAWDIALAHPDLWAGLIAIAPSAGRFVTHYWPNARRLPIYVVGGELDRGVIQRNATDLDRYFAKGFDATYVEYRGRGHEHFSDEILRIFDWMGRKKRTFFPREIDAVSMRPWDRFFWWVEMEGLPPRTVVLPEQWPPAPGVRPFQVEAKVGATNSLSVRCGADRVRVWLSPELVDFTRPLTVTLDGQRLLKGQASPDAAVMLEDLRLRCDRQHPFWAVLESTRGRKD
jgi:pimeloyl-ACP methyl ester carboxylesterase